MNTQSNNNMNIELLKAMRGIWIIEIETLEKKFRSSDESYHAGQLDTFNKCLQDLINIIGED